MRPRSGARCPTRRTSPPSGSPARDGTPGTRVLARGVVDHEVGDHAHPALVRRLDERCELVDRAELGAHGQEVGDVVAPVAERRGIERQQPDAVDPSHCR